MIRSHHQQHQLQRIETGLLRSDPQLTAMLGIFGKLSAGQAMPAWEQVPATRRDRIRQAAALTVQAITLAAAAIGLLLSAVLALLIVVVVGTRHSHRLPAPGPERTRRSRGSDGRSDPAGQSLWPMSTSTLMAGRRPQPARPGPLGKLAQQLLISRRQLRFGLAPVLCHVSHVVSPLSLELHR